MAEVDGDWDCTAETPMGEQRFTLSVTSRGDRFDGRLSGALGAIDVADGQRDGDTLRWSMGISSPLPLMLTCEATIAGDVLDGTVQAGGFGRFPVRGQRRG